MGATYRLVSWLKNHAIECYHAVSERKVTEIQKGEEVIKKVVFKHVRWRRY